MPLKQVTVPRFELSAATVSVRLDKVVKRELELPLTDASTFWTDSTSVLRYIKNENKRFHTFVANRIAMVRDGSHPDQWRHVGGDLNPADDLSRGLSAEALLNSERWLKGPEFLWMPLEFLLPLWSSHHQSGEVGLSTISSLTKSVIFFRVEIRGKVRETNWLNAGYVTF